MDSSRGPSAHLGTATRQPAQGDSVEQLLDVFKAAALSVTKLYKTSAMAESRARSEGYQECLNDLLMLLDKEDMGLIDGEGWKVRAWATERLNGRDVALQATESEDELERRDRTTSPDLARATNENQQTASKSSETPTINTSSHVDEYSRIVVPTQDSFTFPTTHQYPNIATLDLSDAIPHDAPPHPASRGSRSRMNGPKSVGRNSGHLGRGAGAKRRWDFDDLFGGCLGGKDPTGNGGKRGRHA